MKVLYRIKKNLRHMSYLKMMLKDLQQNFPENAQACKEIEEEILKKNFDYQKNVKRIKDMFRDKIQEGFQKIKKETGKNTEFTFSNDMIDYKTGLMLVETIAQTGKKISKGSGWSRLSARAIAIKNLTN